jgi:thiamine biosynthesis lipoprotein
MKPFIRNSFLCLGISLFIFTSRAFPQDTSATLFEVKADKYLMGTLFTITVSHTSVDSSRKAIYYALKEVERIQDLMSTTIPASEIYIINRNAGIKPVRVSYETYSIIERSIMYSKIYNGLFDITIGPISELWGLNSDHPVTEVPPANVIDSLVKFVDYRKIVLNANDTSVYLPEKPMKLDLGGIAKGYAVDRASMVLQKHGINNFFVNGGGDVYVSGTKDGINKWTLGIEHPRKKGELVGELQVSNTAVGTSGDYERFVIIDGVRYCHIFDTKTGYSSRLSQSASAIAPTTEQAVVLSKILFILGYEKYNDQKPDLHTAGVIVDSSGVVHYDSELTSEYSFKLVK